MRKSTAHWVVETKKWIVRYTFLLNVFVMALGLIFVLVGSQCASDAHQLQNMEDASKRDNIGSICSSIGCSLIASGIVSFLIYPSLESQEMLLLRQLRDESGLYNVYSNGNLLNDNSREESWPKETVDLISDNTADLNEALRLCQNSSGRLHVRILARQPVLSENQNIIRLLETSISGKEHCELRYYSGVPLPCYCRRDNYIILENEIITSTNKLRILYQYDLRGKIGETGKDFFEYVWESAPDSFLVAHSKWGRATSNQRACIEAILKYFCEMSKQSLQLIADIEAVVVIWTDQKLKRRTFYSCNKPKGAGTANVREYSSGVVGVLQKKLEEVGDDASHRANCILFYDSEENANECQYIIESRTGEIKRESVKPQEWANKDTKAMLAISLFRSVNGTPEVFGALTYDFAETLKGKKIEEKKTLFSYATQCRDLILPLLASSFETDYESKLLDLEKQEQNAKMNTSN